MWLPSISKISCLNYEAQSSSSPDHKGDRRQQRQQADKDDKSDHDVSIEGEPQNQSLSGCQSQSCRFLVPSQPYDYQLVLPVWLTIQHDVFGSQDITVRVERKYHRWRIGVLGGILGVRPCLTPNIEYSGYIFLIFFSTNSQSILNVLLHLNRFQIEQTRIICLKLHYLRVLTYHVRLSITIAQISILAYAVVVQRITRTMTRTWLNESACLVY